MANVERSARRTRKEPKQSRVAIKMLVTARRALNDSPQNILVAWEAMDIAAREIRRMGAMLDYVQWLMKGNTHWREILQEGRSAITASEARPTNGVRRPTP